MTLIIMTLIIIIIIIIIITITIIIIILDREHVTHKSFTISDEAFHHNYKYKIIISIHIKRCCKPVANHICNYNSKYPNKINRIYL